MQRVVLRRWLVAIAALVVLTATGDAFAVEHCVGNMACTTESRADEAGAEDLCDGRLLIESDHAPISLDEGASAVAPRPIHPVDDAVAKAPPSCDPVATSHGSVGPDDDRSPSWPEPVADAALNTTPPLPVAPAPRRILPRWHFFVPPRGVARTVDRPPRG